MELTAEEVRVLGSLLEKALTRPDDYPLTLNTLIAACNQSTNREPVVEYDELTVERALSGLREKDLARRGVYAGSRVPKHRHAVDESLGLDAPAQAVLAVLLLRGPQTLGEIKTRTERLYAFAGVDEVDATIDALIARVDPLAVRLSRQPGQKEARVGHLLGGADAASITVGDGGSAITPVVSLSRAFDDDHPSQEPAPRDRIDQLEHEVFELRREVAELREAVQQMYDSLDR